MIKMRRISKHKRIYLLVKSDRINALRKQYDAFLEKDKKRKERNDFILGRLDKMRYTTALVPVRHKPSTRVPHLTVIDNPEYQPQFSSVRDFQPSIANQRQIIPDFSTKNNEDTFLIQELSKKYILIPKLKTTFLGNYISNEPTTNQNSETFQEMRNDQNSFPIKDLKVNTNENTDWKSKYEILNILKNEEKELQTRSYHTDLSEFSKQGVHKESDSEKNQNQDTIHNTNFVNTDVYVKTAKTYVDECPEKDLPTNTLDYELPKDSRNTVCENFITNNNIAAANDDQTCSISNNLKNISLENNNSFPPNIDTSEATNYDQSESNVNMTSTSADVCPKQSIDINEENLDIENKTSVEVSSLKIDGQGASVENCADSEHVVYVDDNESSPIQVVNSEMLGKEIKFNAPPIPDFNDGIIEGGNSTIVNYVEEFQQNNDTQIKTDADADVFIPAEEQTDLFSNIDTMEPENYVIEQTENPVNISESIDDFDAEQKEMFYAEQTAETYPNQQGDAASAFNQEYSQNEYAQNQEYAYYDDNTEAEAYPVELNEEITQQYDPNYEEQYAGLDQTLEQQQYVQQYLEPEGGTNQVEPEFEVPQYEQQLESQTNIEETLDVEDGYIGQQLEAQAVEMEPNKEAVEIGKSDVEKVSVSK